MMTKALELAMAKASQLPEPAQEALGREMLERIEALATLRAELQVGIDQLDAGLGEELDLEEMLRELHEEHAGR
jgi:hypothetical protein